jgi:hypothetical protein
VEGGGDCGRGPDPEAGPHLLQDDRRSYHPVPPSGIPRKQFKNSQSFHNFYYAIRKKDIRKRSKLLQVFYWRFSLLLSPSANTGRLYNRMGSLYNRTGRLYSRTDRLNNKMSRLYNRTGRLYIAGQVVLITR